MTPEMKFLLDALLRGPTIMLRVCGASADTAGDLKQRLIDFAKAEDLKTVPGPLCQVFVTESPDDVDALWPADDVGRAIH